MNPRYPSTLWVVLMTVSLPTCEREILLGVEEGDSGVGGASGRAAGVGAAGGILGAAGVTPGGQPVCGDQIPEGPEEQCDEGGGTLTCSVKCKFRDRVTDGLVLLYTFEEGAGDRVFDRSGHEAPLNLTIPDRAAVVWKPGSLILEAPVLVASDTAATKLASAVRTSNAFSVEAWVSPANIEQDGPARVVTVSNAGYARNFMLGQSKSVVAGRARTTTTGDNGYPELESETSLEARTVHLVFTHAADGSEVIFIDGVENSQRQVTGDLSNWDETFRLALGAEFNEDLTTRDFLGELFLVAVYARALSATEIQRNFLDGP